MMLFVPDDTHHRVLSCDEKAPNPAAGSGRTVVLGIRQDTSIRDLLTWALIKVANAGDSVATLHVVAAAADGVTSLS
jgi:hypothetical protein